MLRHPQLQELKQYRTVTRTWGGLNRRPNAAEHEFRDMAGMCADSAPAISTAKQMLGHRVPAKVQGMVGGNDLWIIAGQRIYKYPITQDDNGVKLPIEDHEVQMVRMGAKIVIFPDKVSYNTVTKTFRSLDAAYDHTGTIVSQICRKDGTVYDGYTTAKTAPEAPKDGTLWMDISAAKPTLKRYDGALKAWVPVASTYIKISGLPMVGADIHQGDGISISKSFGAKLTSTSQIPAEGATQVVEKVGPDYIVIPGILRENLSEEATIKLRRTAPDMEFVVECNNRLWGCHYGTFRGLPVNEIYACKLGDETNWRVYDGTSMASYTASRGSEGPWTGAFTYGNHPYFFKENCYDKVFVSERGAHSIVSAPCDGPLKNKTIAIAGNALYWLSHRGLVSFDGAATRPVDDMMIGVEGNVACGYGDKLRIYGTSDRHPVYTLDLLHGLWHIEDSTQEAVDHAAAAEGKIFCTTTAAAPALVYHKDDQHKVMPSWMISSAVIGCDSPKEKYISRLMLRFDLEPKGFLDIYVRYDGLQWERKQHIKGDQLLRTHIAAILPHRCDHMEIKLEGLGEFTLWSLSKVTEEGSEYL